jgi:hypothetical protein
MCATRIGHSVPIPAQISSLFGAAKAPERTNLRRSRLVGVMWVSNAASCRQSNSPTRPAHRPDPQPGVGLSLVPRPAFARTSGPAWLRWLEVTRLHLDDIGHAGENGSPGDSARLLGSAAATTMSRQRSSGGGAEGCTGLHTVQVFEKGGLHCTYFLYAPETYVVHLRQSGLPPRTALGFRFRTSDHPALGPAL